MVWVKVFGASLKERSYVSYASLAAEHTFCLVGMF